MIGRGMRENRRKQRERRGRGANIQRPTFNIEHRTLKFEV
jgi:hypothetical protein